MTCLQGDQHTDGDTQSPRPFKEDVHVGLAIYQAGPSSSSLLAFPVDMHVSPLGLPELGHGGWELGRAIIPES